VIELVPADERWPSDFEWIAQVLHQQLGDDARRIDHIGSTSVPGLPSKDVIDVQITAEDEASLGRIVATLDKQGWRRAREFGHDHHVPGLPTDQAEWRKAFFDEPVGERPIHVHVRIAGRANHRYALLFRDYLRVHPDTAATYLALKRRLAQLTSDSVVYADAKDPACDLIYLAAEDWARHSGWTNDGVDTRGHSPCVVR
jgi:GrpB-like predicted nucleotidyltransferase (UPF0157 family)